MPSPRRAWPRAGARRADVLVDGQERRVPVPYPSPGDWRALPIYFLMLDRFNNPDRPPNGPWDRRFDFRQGGTFSGVQAQLGYLQELGARARSGSRPCSRTRGPRGAGTITAMASRIS